MQHCGYMLSFSVVGIRPVGLKAVPDGMRECLHSAFGLAVLFRPPAGSGHIGPLYLSPAKTFGRSGHAQFLRFHICVNGVL